LAMIFYVCELLVTFGGTKVIEDYFKIKKEAVRSHGAIGRLGWWLEGVAALVTVPLTTLTS